MSDEYTKSLEAAARSKVCARNYSDKEVPNEVIEHLLKIATGGPYKQGRRWLDVYAITNKELINKLYLETARPDEYTALEADPRFDKFTGEPITFIGNAQVLAPVLFVITTPIDATPEYPEELYWDPTDDDKESEEQQNMRFAIGSTMGMLVYEANRLGLHTGNCACYEHSNVNKIFKEYAKTDDFEAISLMIGAGYPKEEWSESAMHQMREHPFARNHVYHPPWPKERDNPKSFIIS